MLNAVQAFVRGFSAYFKVIPFFSRLGLWKYLLLTACISFGVLVCISLLAYAASQVVFAIPFATIFGPYPGFEIVLAIVAFIAILAIGVLLFKHLVLIATAPWMGKVAERVSNHLTETAEEYADPASAKTKQQRWSLVKRSVRLNGRLFSFEMLLTIPLLILGLVPVINFGAAAALVVVQAYFVGAGTLDFTLEERYSYKESIAFFNQNRWLTIGLGLGFVLLLFTAVGFLLAPAWSAAASAYAFHEYIGDQQPEAKHD